MCAPNVPLDMGGILVELLSQTSKLIERVDCLTVKVESVESNMNSQISGLAVEMRGLAVAQSLQLEELSILSSQSQSSSSSKQSERVLDVVADHRWICPVCHRTPPFSHADSFKGHIRNLSKQPLNNSAHCYLHAASAEHRSLVENFPGESFDVNKMFAKKRLSRSRPAMYQNRAGLVVIWVIGIQKQQRSENFRQCQLHGCQRICIWPRCLRLMRPGACSRSPAAARSCGQCCIINVHIPKKTCR